MAKVTALKPKADAVLATAGLLQEKQILSMPATRIAVGGRLHYRDLKNGALTSIR